MKLLRTLTRTDHKSLPGRLLRLPLRLVPSGAVIRIPSGVNKGFRWVCGSSIQRCWFGTYEMEKQDFVARAVRPGMTVWDVGANVGFYTLAFARLVGGAGSVYAFEPMAANVAYLLRHVEMNGLINVKIIQTALGGSDEIVGFSATRASSQGSVTDRGRNYLIPAMTPGNFLKTFPESLPHLIKLDIEGAEGAVLAAAEPLLVEHSPDILLALHGREQEEKCRALLTRIGYRLFYTDGAEVSGELVSDEIFATRRSL